MSDKELTRQQKWYRENKERSLANDKKWREANPKKRSDQNKRYRDKFKQEHGMSPTQYYSLKKDSAQKDS
jgi:hypothetical protein